MKISKEGRLGFGSLLADLGGDPDVPEGETPVDCCDPGEPPPDRALDSTAYTVNTPGVGGIVQIKSGPWIDASATPKQLAFDTPPTNGNTLYAFVFTPNGSVVTSSGWSLLESASISLSSGVDVYSKVAGAAESSTVTISNGGAGARRMVLYEVAGTQDVHDDRDGQPNASPLTAATLTPTDEPGVLIAAFVSQVAIYAATPTQTPVAPLVTDSFSREGGTVPKGRNVTWTGHRDTALASYAVQLTTTGLYAGTTTGSVAVVTLTASPTPPEWNVIAPNTIDGDDASYHEIDGPDILRVDLGGTFRIVRARLLIGGEDAGDTAYTIRGANDADFGDAVTLGSTTVDATGSFTGDDFDITWQTTVSYRYFELSGDDVNRRVYSFELYEPDTSEGQDHTHPDIETEIDELAASVDELATSGLPPTGAAGGDLSGTYPNPEVVDDSHNHTSATAPGAGASSIGPLLLSSDHAIPITFDDILQASDGADLLYASTT